MTANSEIDAGERFQFGANWAHFLADIDDERIADAETALQDMLSVSKLDGLRFLDIGSGSGLSSLAARRLGAYVHSFDFDPASVACTSELRRRYFPADENWKVEQGSALDNNYLEALGEFDVVYSWGVLHHTGAMWVGIENAVRRVSAANGKLFIAIYNDQGWKSHLWWFIKATYNRLPRIFKAPFATIVMAFTHLLVILKYTAKLQPMTAIRPLLQSKRARGMSAKHDKIDWIGGFPYEFASFAVLSDYLKSRGFSLIGSRRSSSLGCHELALIRTSCVE